MNLINSEALSMTSLEIAELVDARHDSVKRAVERLASRGVIEFPPMVEIPTATKPISVYQFEGEQGKRDSIVVVAQLSPEFTARLVDRWQELESRQQIAALPGTYIQALEHLLESKKQEQLAIEQRDHAVATKALIGSKREATAMAKASAASREARRLKEELGRGVTQATVLAVEKALNRSLGHQGYRPLKVWCDTRGIVAPHVNHPTYGRVKAWPAAAWADVYLIDLNELFGVAEEEA